MARRTGKSAETRPRRGKRGRPRRTGPGAAPGPEAPLPPLPDSNPDGLTGLPDGRSIRELARYRVAEAARNGRPLTLGVIDADDFREVNEVFGVRRADLFLKGLVKRLKSGLKGFEIGRLAGDLFLVLLPDLEPERGFVELEAVRAAISEKPLTTGRGASYRKHALTVSIGVAGFPRDGVSFEDLLSHVLAAVRRAKRLGKDRVGLPPDDVMSTRTSHYPRSQLEALRGLSRELDCGEAALLREALEDLLLKYKDRRPVAED